MPKHNKTGLLEVPEDTKIKVYPNPPLVGKESYKGAEKDLFPSPPRIEDVIQGNIGNCYLLAAIISIINSKDGPEVIENMMKDDGKYIIVRLFNDKLKPRYFKIEKSYVYIKWTTQKKHADKTLWVIMLEKAFLVFKWRNELKEQKEKVDPKEIKDWYEDFLGGGNAPDTALKILLGKEADSLEAMDQGFHQLIKLFTGTMPNFSQSVPKSFKPDPGTCAKVFGNSPETVTAWEQWACGQERVISLIEAAGSKPIFTIDAFFSWFEGELKKDKLDEFLVLAVRKYVAGEAILPGVLAKKRGSGIYNEYMIELYDIIAKALTKQLPVAVHSKGKVGGVGKKGPGGEDEWKGLFSDHAYAVLGIRDEPFPGNPKVKLKMIQLRNPHGKVGRDYVWKEKNGVQVLSAKETKDGTFWLELSDLTKRFKGVYVGKEAAEALNDKDEV